MRYLYVLREVFAGLFCSLSVGCSIWFMVMLAQEYNDNEQRKKERCVSIGIRTFQGVTTFTGPARVCQYELLDSEWPDDEKPENPPPGNRPKTPGVPPLSSSGQELRI